MKNTNPVSTPIVPHFRFSAALSPQSVEDKSYMSYVPYSCAVGSLMYAMACTRLDFSHVVNVMSRCMANPSKTYWQVVKWILRYLRGSSNICLEFERSDDSLLGYIDADFAGDLDIWRSLTGYIFSLCGCYISWKATLQSTVALSITEVEYIAMTEVVKQAIWLRGL